MLAMCFVSPRLVCVTGSIMVRKGRWTKGRQKAPTNTARASFGAEVGPGDAVLLPMIGMLTDGPHASAKAVYQTKFYHCRRYTFYVLTIRTNHILSLSEPCNTGSASTFVLWVLFSKRSEGHDRSKQHERRHTMKLLSTQRCRCVSDIGRTFRKISKAANGFMTSH